MFFLTFLVEIVSKGWFRRSLKTLIWSSLFISLAYLNVFLFVALDNWGHPLTHDIAGVYAQELNQLIAAMPFPFWAIVLLNLVPVLGAVAGFYFLAGKLKDTPLVYTGKQLKFRLLQGFIYLLPLLLVNGYLKQDWPRFIIRNSSVSSYDPVLTFLYPRKIQGESFKSNGAYLADAKVNYPKTKEGGKNVVLIICDAFRADHLGAYGYDRPVSPFFDSLAALPETLLHPSFFSNHSRSFSGITDVLSSTAEITFHKFYIHDLLQMRGYKTHAILSGDHTNFFHLKGYLGKSIDLYHDGFDALRTPFAGRASVNDDFVHIVDYIRRMPSFSAKSNFLYLHLMSTHQVSGTKDKFRRYKPDEANGLSLTSEVLINDYDNSLIQLDASLRETFWALKDKGVLDDAILVITGDHGQALLEDGKRYWHGKSTQLSETHIPLLIYTPSDSTFSQRPSKRFADHLDVAPTILDLLGIEPPEVWEGQSVFTSEKPHRVEQKEQDYYSFIDLADTMLVQYTYQAGPDTSVLLNISDLSAPVVLRPEQSVLDSLHKYIPQD
jgi:glucan phosphoethanolaminetransferase (alkaline phosphatase superfamily)